MKIDKQTLEHELEGLREDRKQTEWQALRIDGAIQAIEQLIKMLDAPEPTPEEVKHEDQISA